MGRDHVGLIARLNHLSRCLKATGDVDGAVACHDRCAAILRKLRGPDAPRRVPAPAAASEKSDAPAASAIPADDGTETPSESPEDDIAYLASDWLDQGEKA